MLLCAITDRSLYPGDEVARCAALLRQASEWARDGAVSVIQLREKDLPPDRLQQMAGELIGVAAKQRATLVLVNGAPALARSAGARGVHLSSRATSERSLAARMHEVEQAWGGEKAIVSVACHSPDEAAEARELGANLIVFAPVFEKPLREGGVELRLPGAGLEALRAACGAAGKVPVVALGGVTPANAAACLAAGAAGVAGIRLFAGEGWRRLVAQRP